jgi:thiamine-phosphate pyrophosphorylase
MRLIVISNPFEVPNEGKLINQLFRAGLNYFHIRKPESNLQTLKDLLNKIEPCFYNRIALHQFHEIAAEFNIKRLHYPETVRKASSLQTIQNQLADGFILSTSIHDITSLPMVQHFHYIFYGPVFNSISKAGYKSKVSEDFRLDKANLETKVIGLGGVQGTNLTSIKRMGFDGVAVLGTIWTEPNKAVEKFTHLKEQLTSK